MKQMLLGLCLSVTVSSTFLHAAKPNILIITVDDMSADSLGAFGCKLPETSPTIDQFAKRAMKFNHAHVHVGNCMPGRNIMWSGMYSHVNGVEGFRQKKDADYPVLCDLAKQAGYFTGIRGKTSHSTPYTPYAWDVVLDTGSDGKKHHIKDAKSYGQSLRDGLKLASDAGKPFCFIFNISDPHKPFFAQGKNGVTIEDKHVPSRVFTADEVPVPGFLPDDEVIRKELAHYYSSVRRADDCFREIMIALDEFGASNLFIMFLSDHGMPLPFAKTQLYHHSTHTPLLVSWNGVTEPGSVDNHHMVGAIDFVPTLLDVMQHKHPTPERLHGRSFASLLRGEKQSDRDHIILQYNENAGANRHPMRGIQTRENLYLFNIWSDGQRKFATATTGTMTYRQMVKRAEKETYVSERLELFDHRVLHELYDVKNDPDCLVNLIASEDASAKLKELRAKLKKELQRIKDPTAPLMDSLNDTDLIGEYMAKEDRWTVEYKEAKQAKKKSSANKPKKLSKNAIAISVTQSPIKGGPCEVQISHKLPKQLGKLKAHVTLKQATLGSKNAAGKRIAREVREIEGEDSILIRFTVPEDLKANALRVAVFVGEDFDSNRFHMNSEPIAVK